MGRLRKILVVHQNLQPPGGANTVAAWIVEALKSHYALTLLAWNRVNTAEINRFHGTSLQQTAKWKSRAATRASVSRRKRTQWKKSRL
jgi:hypothetical protein